MEPLGSYVRRYKLDGLLSPVLVAALRPVAQSPGDLIIRADDRVRDLLFFVEGRAKVYRTMENGKNLLATYVVPFDVLGEVEIFSLDRYSMNVEAITESVCLALPVAAIRRAADHNARLFMYLCGRLGTKLAHRVTAAAVNLSYPVENRLARYLLAVTDRDGLALGTDNLGELADFLGTSYRQLARVVRRFRSEGVMDQARGRIRVINRAKLAPRARDLYA